MLQYMTLMLNRSSNLFYNSYISIVVLTTVQFISPVPALYNTVTSGGFRQTLGFSVTFKLGLRTTGYEQITRNVITFCHNNYLRMFTFFTVKSVTLH